MNIKLLTSVGCLLLLAAAISPSALGHDERAALPGSPAGLGTNDDGVSGAYIGAAGPAIALEAYTNPDGTLATGGILCDAEVVVDAAGFPLNEQGVDGNADGLAPNTVDDGGQGGACHVNSYQTAGYNTNGCLTGQSAGGHDLSGQDNWLSASCDYQTVEGDQNSLLVLALCVVNEGVLQTDPSALLPCVDAFVFCTLDPTCQDGQVSCGSDGFVDGIHYGYGSGAFGVKAGFPTVGGCAGFPATSSIFVWEAVGTNGDLPVVYPPSIGDVWTDLTGGLLPCGASSISVTGGASPTPAAQYGGTVTTVFTLGANRVLTGESVTKTAGPAGEVIQHQDAGNKHTWTTSAGDTAVRTFSYSFTTTCPFPFSGGAETFSGSYTQWN